ncbi:YwhD family protein [Viridibacillus arvi]|uniref:YwhD family protein n=1 Tax=Viridibacillus arvi TaxID=263475 RepID=UPI0036CFA636
MEPFKKKIQFNILSSDSTNGDGSFGVGTLDLNNITPVIIDVEREDVFIDMEALHGRSRIEKKVRFAPNREHAGQDYFTYWIVWIAMQTSSSGAYYAGCTASEVLVSKEERRIKLGYKSLPEQVNMLDKAMKGNVIMNHLDSKSKQLLYHFLKSFNEDYWAQSPQILKEQLI